MNTSIRRLRGRAKASGTALLAIAALTVAACSSSKNNASAGSKTTANHSASYDATIAALAPASYLSKGTLTVAANATYPPDEYFASDNKTIIGFDPDLADAVASVLGINLKFENVAFDDIIPGLQAGHFDLAWSSATATPERQQAVNFVTYFKGGVGFLLPAGSGISIRGLSDLCGLKVAVEAGSLEDTTATAQSKKCTAAGRGAISIQRYQNENQNILALTSGRAQVSTAGSQIVPYLVKQSRGKLKTPNTAYDFAPLGVEFPKSTPAGVLKAFQAALNKIISDGTYGKILAKWDEQLGAISKSEILPPAAAG